jgi:hypothetical protein
MNERGRRRRPQLESLETMTLLSGLPAAAHQAARRDVSPASAHISTHATLAQALGPGTIGGTFFAHRANSGSGTIYSLFASGKLAPLGPVLLVGGFSTAGFAARGAGGGNLAFTSESNRGNLLVRLTELPAGSAPTPGRYHFSYVVAHGSGAIDGARGSGTVEITLRPIRRNIHGQPVSNPGFFGNSTLTFHPNAVTRA